MQLLFLDESGTHAGSPNLVIGGVSLHESHLGEATRRLDDLMASALSSRGLVAADYEFHAAEMKSPKPQKRGKKASLWLAIAENDRMALLADAYDIIGSLQCTEGWHGCGLFAAVMDARFHAGEPEHQREQLAYETVLNKFDDALDQDRRASLGMVIHDERLVAQDDIQTWTREWQESAGRVGRLEKLALVPFFADSRGSRLLQVADLVAWGLHRHYTHQDDRWVDRMWPAFHFRDGHMHGLIHLTPEFKKSAGCTCRPCARRRGGDLTPI